MRLVDSDVAIDYLRGRRGAVELLQGLDDAGEPMAASEMLRFEVLAGIRAEEHAATERLFLALTWIPVVEEVARHAASLVRQHRARNVGIEDADYLVAATSLEFDLPLLTRNVKHFPMLPGLEPAY